VQGSQPRLQATAFEDSIPSARFLKALDLARQLPECEVFSSSDREGDVFEVYQTWLHADGGSRAEWIIRATPPSILSPCRVPIPDAAASKNRSSPKAENGMSL
jgi:hypothetical protein